METFAASPLAPAVTLQQLVLRREASRDVAGRGGRCGLTYKIMEKNEGGCERGKQKGELAVYIKNNVCGGGERDEKERQDH